MALQSLAKEMSRLHRHIMISSPDGEVTSPRHNFTILHLFLSLAVLTDTRERSDDEYLSDERGEERRAKLSRYGRDGTAT